MLSDLSRWLHRLGAAAYEYHLRELPERKRCHFGGKLGNRLGECVTRADIVRSPFLLVHGARHRYHHIKIELVVDIGQGAPDPSANMIGPSWASSAAWVSGKMQCAKASHIRAGAFWRTIGSIVFMEWFSRLECTASREPCAPRSGGDRRLVVLPRGERSRRHSDGSIVDWLIDANDLDNTPSRSSWTKSEGASSRMVDLPFNSGVLDRSATTPLNRQLYDYVRGLIARRILTPETRLPATRRLAEDLGVSRNTVVATYAQLESDGLVMARHGSRYKVIASFDALQDATPQVPRSTYDPPPLSCRGTLMADQVVHTVIPGQVAFHPGTPDLREFPFKTWRKLLARQLQATTQHFFGYHSISGHPPLRAAIARNLATSRGVRCDPEQVLVTTGAQAALDLLARLLLDPGDTVWMEEPGYPGAHVAFTSAGASVAALPVDERGWHADRVARAMPRLIYLTPSCHAPLGVTMTVEQRQRLADIARRSGAWIIEDDFDAEYRFAGPALPAIQGMDIAGRTIYLGTFAKTVFPALRIGFVVLPRVLAERVESAVFYAGAYAPLVLQATLASFIDEGHFARHLRRMRLLYAERRQLFLDLSQNYLARWLKPIDGYAGMQTSWWLRSPLDDRRLAQEARRRSMVLTPVSEFYHYAQPRQGLILGFAPLREAEMHRDLAALRELLASLAG